MASITAKIRLEPEDGTFEEIFFEDMHFSISAFLNKTYIGYIDGNAGDDYIHIELIHIDEEYRRKGYGHMVMEELKRIGKSLGIQHIDGECKSSLKRFYMKLGAKFECREPEDFNYMLNKFYIDL